MTFAPSHVPSDPRVLVAIASYGVGNDHYLRRLVDQYASMSFETDILIVSNIEKKDFPNALTLVGMPNKKPWSLPFSHKKLFVDTADHYDLFVYSEDDILITEENLRAFLGVTSVLREDEIVGFFRFEKGADGAVNYPDVHWRYHWDPDSVRKRKNYTLAHFTNEHSACYALTRAQLLKAINTGGFDVDPHDGKYDLLCTAATDPYTQCGFTKLIPISHISDFTVHHLSNKYVGRVGVDEPELRRQIGALMEIERAGKPPRRLLTAETRLPDGIYSKDYYELATPEVMALIPKSARSILSIGCGCGAIEIALAESGLSVTAVPLDAVISLGASEFGVEMSDADFRSAREQLEGRRFDAMLMLNVLHLTPDPGEVLASFSALLSTAAPIIIQSPNMSNLPAIWRQIRDRRIETPRSFAASGTHFSSRRALKKWCGNAGLSIERTTEILHRRFKLYEGVIPAAARRFLASDIIAVAKCTIPLQNRSPLREST